MRLQGKAHVGHGIEVFVDGPRGGPGRAWRWMGSALAGVSLTAGLIASVPALMLSLYAVVSVPATGDLFAPSPPGTRETLLTSWVLTGLVTVVGLAVGVRLLRRGRALVLFLRRFGDTEATQVVSRAARAIGRSWRVVTLDDEQIAPVGLGRGIERSAGAVSHGTRAVKTAWRRVSDFLAAAMTFAFLGSIAALYVISTRHDSLEVVLSSSVAIEVLACQLLVLVFLAALAGRIVLGLLRGVGLVGRLPVLIPSMFLSSTIDAVRAAESAKAIRVSEPAAIDRQAVAAAELCRKVFAPKLTVLRVASSIWQPTVRRFAAVSSAVLVDVSEPTENVLWEVEEVTRRQHMRCVFICHHHRLADLVTPSESSTPVIHRLRTLLDGRPILAYSTDVGGTARFVRALRATLESGAGQ